MHRVLHRPFCAAVRGRTRLLSPHNGRTRHACRYPGRFSALSWNLLPRSAFPLPVQRPLVHLQFSWPIHDTACPTGLLITTEHCARHRRSRFSGHGHSGSRLGDSLLTGAIIRNIVNCACKSGRGVQGLSKGDLLIRIAQTDAVHRRSIDSSAVVDHHWDDACAERGQHLRLPGSCRL